MIDGYSVQEAASVLGVPEGRVWELLARGVLSGTPEGDSMRVYLKADAGPITRTAQRDEPPKTNGNGGSHVNGGEASAFRELLTEFRNLTERYGQALLALGEARGEVAGLRSRVELLEARLDLRLPVTPDAGSVGWGPPAGPPVPPVALESPRIVPAAAEPGVDAERVAPPSRLTRRGSRGRKGQPTRKAVEGFAQALARAQDPTTAEVGDEILAGDHAPAAEGFVASPLEDAVEEPTHEAVAAPSVPEPIVAEPEQDAEPEPERATAEQTVSEVAAEPEPEPAVAELELAEPPAAGEPAVPEPADAEEEPIAAEIQAAFGEPEISPDAPEVTEAEAQTTTAEAGDAAPLTYSAAVVEPDWFADGDFAWLDAADLEASSRSVEGTTAPAAVEQPPVEATPTEPELAEEPAAEPISATEAAPWAESDSIIEPDRPSMPELPPMPDLPPALDLPPAPEAQLQPGPELQPEPEVAQSVVELTEPIQPFEATPLVEPEHFEAAAAEQAELGEPFQVPPPDVGPPEEEVMWLGADGAGADEIETASTGWRAEPGSAPTLTAPPPVAAPEPPLLRMTEEELARLARDEGWDEAEVAAIRAMIVPPPPRRVQLPGAAELDDAMAALQAVPVDTNEDAYSSREWAKPPGEARSPRYDDWAFAVEPAPSPKPLVDPPRRQPVDPGWLRRRQGPAATAYRRLRRLFPG